MSFVIKFHLCGEHMVVSDFTVKPQYKKEQFDVQDEILTKLILTVNQSSCNNIQHYETTPCIQTTTHNSNFTHDSKSPVYKVIALISTVFSQNGTIINEDDLTYAYGELATLECRK